VNTTPCEAVAHCHRLNARVDDLEAELARLRTRIEALGEDSQLWHNRLARESRRHATALAAHRDTLDQLTTGGLHCATCFCEVGR
jgi:hypothetical protein